jgi:hypothetical protein
MEEALRNKPMTVELWQEHIWSSTFAATNFDEVFSGYQPRLVPV